MPATQPGSGAAVPPGQPPGAPGAADPYGRPGDPDDVTPWYKRPGPLFALLLVLLAIGGLIAWLLLSGDDDDEPASPESSRLTLEARDATGAALDRGFLIEVAGPAGSETSYRWLRPDDATPGQIAGDGTGSDGRVDFEWQAFRGAGAATVDVVESVPPGWTPPGPLIDCDLQRIDEPDSTVVMSVDVTSGDPTADQEVRYSFPNYAFLPGDAVTCELISTAPVETTTTSTTTTTVEETTTTTVAPETTVAPSTTVPVVTVPPQPEATLWDVIDNSPDLSELKALIELAGLQDVLSDPNATLTLLAPSNEAVELAAEGVGAPDFTNPSVVEAILLTHVDTTQVLLIEELFALPEFVPDNPGPHAIDAEANPPTIGGATVLVGDVEAANGVLHVIDRVLLPETLPD
jgi:uncharacterized surface protein with fasciclin (FAS1) repeats